MLLLSKKSGWGKGGVCEGPKKPISLIKGRALKPQALLGSQKAVGGVKTSISICTWPRHPLKSFSKSRHQMRSHFVKLSPVAPAKF